MEPLLLATLLLGLGLADALLVRVLSHPRPTRQTLK